MAAAQQALGERVLARLANASLEFSGQSVYGLLADEPMEAGIGSVQVRARRKTFLCLSADLAEVPGVVSRGTACSWAGVAMVVADRVDLPATGQAELMLERA